MPAAFEQAAPPGAAAPRQMPWRAVAARWQRWWQARLPRTDTLELTQRNLYILPTKVGWSFAVVLVVLLVASINERVNLGYALTFLLGGSALAATHQTHGNLQGLQLRLLLLEGLLKCLQLRVEGLAQQVYRLVQERTYRVRVGQ